MMETRSADALARALSGKHNVRDELESFCQSAADPGHSAGLCLWALAEQSKIASAQVHGAFWIGCVLGVAVSVAWAVFS